MLSSFDVCSTNATIYIAGLYIGDLTLPGDGQLVIMGANSSILGNVESSGFIDAGETRQLNVYGKSLRTSFNSL